MRRLRLLPIAAAAAVFSSTGVVVCGFTIPSSSNPHQPITERRSFLSNLLVRTSSTLLIVPIVTSSSRSNAVIIPSVTTAEFDVILKDSAKSIVAVELSGPKSETAIVRLVDGTTFTISDLVESSTDPRSPLKLVARCRLYKIPIKNTGLLSAVSGGLISDSGKKTKSYMNPRVQEAEKKEQAKRERMAEDERDRLEQLYKLEGEEKGFLVE
jgi:hypothetical protein